MKFSKKLSIGFGLFVMVFLFAGCQMLNKSSRFKPMSYVQNDLENGMKILWIEDDKLPYFSMKLFLPHGAAHDPQGKSGLAQLTAGLLDKGTKSRSATQIASELEQLGLSFGASSSEDSTLVGIEGLSIHSEKAISEFYDLLTNSNFSQSEIKRQINLTSAQIKKVFDNPKAVASLAFEKSLYQDHPYGLMTSGTESSLKRIQRKDILNFYNSVYQPQGATLAVVGKFGELERKKIKDLFSRWSGSGKALPSITEPKKVEAQIIFVEKSGLKQAEIRMGHLGIPRNHPDYLKLRVTNTILGESFIGRLFSEIREKRGLTYSIYSYFDTREKTGPFVISTFTRLDKIPEMIEETKKVLVDFTQGVSASDVKDAVAYLKGTFPQVIETGDDLARQLLILYRYGVDPAYLAEFMNEVDKVSNSDVNEMLKKHFHPDNLVILVYGPPGSQVGLEKFGKVKKMTPKDFD